MGVLQPNDEAILGAAIFLGLAGVAISSMSDDESMSIAAGFYIEAVFFIGPEMGEVGFLTSDPACIFFRAGDSAISSMSFETFCNLCSGTFPPMGGS